MQLPEGRGEGEKLLVGMKKEGEEKERNFVVSIARLTHTERTLTSAAVERVWARTE